MIPSDRKKRARVVYPNWMYFLTINNRKIIKRFVAVMIGKCKWCNRPIESNGLCKEHIASARKSSAEYQRRDRVTRVKHGFCVVCRNELHPFFDEGYTNCHRCRDRSRNRLTWR